MSMASKYQLVNVAGSVNVLAWAARTGVKRVVTASSAAIYGDKAPLPIREDSGYGGLSPYAESKWEMEKAQQKIWETDQLHTVALRFFNVFGPRQDPNSPYSGVISKFMDLASKGKALTILGDGEQTRDFIYVKDVSAAVITAMTTDRLPSGFHVFNVGTGTETSINELARMITKLFGTDDESTAQGSSSSSIVYGPPREGDIKRSVSDPKLMRERLGFVPSYTVAAGLENTKNWFQKSIKTEL